MSVTAKSIMSTDIIAAHVKMQVSDLSKMLREHDISGAPVVDDNGYLVGVVSITDILLHGEMFDEMMSVDSEYHKSHDDTGYASLSDDFVPDEVENLQVRDIMSTEVRSVSVDTAIEEVARMMYTDRIHRMLVLDDSRLVGILSTMDVLRAVMERVLAPHNQFVD